MDDERWRMVFEQSGAAIALTDDLGMVTDVSPGLCRLLGEDRAAIEGGTFEAIVGARADGPVRRTRSDGTDQWLAVESAPTPTGSIHHVIDMTRQVTAESTLEHLEAQREAIVGLTRMSLEDWSEDELLERTLQLLLEHLAADRAGVAQRLPDDGFFRRISAGIALDGDGRADQRIPPDQQSAYTVAAGTVVVSDDLATEDRFVPDHRLLDVGIRTTASAVVDVDGRPWGVLSAHRREPGTFSDHDRLYLEASARVLSRAIAAERHRNTEEVALEQRRLADAGELAAGLAHDLGNALAVLKLHAQLVLRNPAVPADARSQVAEIEHHTDLAHALVADIVDYAHEGPPDLISTDLGAVLHRLVPVLRRMVRSPVTIVEEAMPTPLWATVDQGRLHQIMLNLVTNAADAMPDGGTVTIGARPVEEPAPGVVLEITDTGTGMAPDVRARAFEPFFTTKPRGAGTGLGLPQVARLVREHGGSIDLTSDPGHGTRATVWLPQPPTP